MDILGPIQVSTTNGVATTFYIPTLKRLKMVSVVGKPTNSANVSYETLLLSMIAQTIRGTVVGYYQEMPIGDCIRSLPGSNGHTGKIFFPKVDVHINTNNEAFSRPYDTYYVQTQVFPVIANKANPVSQLFFGNITMYIDNYDPGSAPEGQYFDVCLGFE